MMRVAGGGKMDIISWCALQLAPVVGSVQNLAVRETTLLCGVMDEVGFLKAELQRLAGFLEDADAKRGSGNGSISIWIRQIRDAAFDAKNIIEIADYMEKRNRLKKGFMGAISRYAHLPSDMITLHNVGVEIQRVRRKISEICESARRLRIVDLGNVAVEAGHVEDESSQDRGLIHESFEEEDFVVGFQDEYKEIVDKLVDQEKNLTIAIDLLRNIMKRIMGGRNESRDADQLQEYEIYLNRFKVLNKLPESRLFPQSLRELVLIADVIKEDPMPVLEKLPCLMVLRLEGYEGRTMSCSANGFQRLQELELKLFSIEEWRIKIPSMPKLCYLTLRWCEHIHRLANGLLHLPSLKELNLEGMRQIFSNEYTYQELQKKGCKVTKYL
ncbi:hypothetical protein EJB05_08699, partial [Eragrostis curvula]